MDIQATDKLTIIDQLTELAEQNGRLNSAAGYRQAVIDRENEASTSLGYSLAVPHGKTDAVKLPFVCFAKSNKGVLWNRQVVHLIFMIGVPEKEKGDHYLRILANIARKVINPEFRQKLMQSTNKQEVIGIIASSENE
ncbi:PTS sugar transporter subunit IIA [Sporolactobacillus sp. CQH2019]|uniref:PTS sugar transporter subunit IIA n=1 Tax=Sporolactobacillus sp. CQH2019 TaxID=3023512 RepID=UPI002368A7D9|nr:PTS sugar transporter subunit IIA [Sporolactobacillus sp. CQH2019]MDD9148859.1 PTS sugar transporter subunit IIA [Sporolactobacillus sp. CQH2019]